MTRAVAAVVVLAAVLAGCAGDPPSAVVGLQVVGCSPHPEIGSGMFVDVNGIGGIDEPLVLTSAHVVKGARDITVTRGGARGTATIVAFDPDMDLAYLAVDGIGTRFPWSVDSDAVVGGERGVAYVVRDGEAVSLPVTVARRVQIRTEDVYIEGETMRPGYELAVDIDAGDSGAAVVVDGKVVGVVWARSRRDSERAYAIDPVRAGERVRRQLDTGDLTDVDLTRCS